MRRTPAPDILRTLRILAQQCAEGQLHLRHGPTIGGYIGSGRIDQAARLLQRHAVGHPVTIHRGRSTPPILAAGHNCARRSANYAGSRATGNRSWATSAVSDNITPRKAHCEESSSARAARVEFLSAPKSDTSPRHLRLDGVFLDDLRLCIIVALRPIRRRRTKAGTRRAPRRSADPPPRRASRRRPDRGCSPTPAKSTSRASDRGRHATTPRCPRANPAGTGRHRLSGVSTCGG